MLSKKVEKEVVDAIGTIPMGRMSGVRRLLLTLKVGEVAHIVRADWKWKKQSPDVMCKRITKKLGFHYTVEKAADRSGWFVERVEKGKE